jgi:nitronate monooxygenase
MMATRFMATKECPVHDNIKQEIVRRQEQDTTLICKSIHLQARALRNKNVEDILAIEKRGGGFEEILPFIMGKRVSEAWDTGNVDLAPMMVGQSVGLVRDIPTCAELLERMTREAEERLAAARGRIR